MRHFLLLFLFVESVFGSITVKSMEIGEKKGLHGNTALSFDTKRGNTTRDSYKASVKVTYDEEKSISLGVNSLLNTGQLTLIKTQINSTSIHAISMQLQKR